MDVLITGGAGFIGLHLTCALLAAGHAVTLLDNLHPQVHFTRLPPKNLPETAELIVADVRDRQALSLAVTRADAVYHLAALTGVGQSMYKVADYTNVNVGGTATLMDILANEKHHVQRLILASSRAVYGEGAYECAACGQVVVTGRERARLAIGVWEPVCPHCGAFVQSRPTPESHTLVPNSVYAATKLAQEHLARCVGAAYDLPVVILRYFNVYGPGQSLSNPYTGILSIFFSQLQNGKRVEIYEDGLESRDFVHVSDVVQANLLALERPEAAGQTINVGSGQATSVLEIARQMARLVGRSDNLYVSGRFRVGDIRHCYADMTQAQRLLGYSPQVTLQAGLADFLQWASAQKAHDQSGLAEQELLEHGLFWEEKPDCRGRA